MVVHRLHHGVWILKLLLMSAVEIIRHDCDEAIEKIIQASGRAAVVCMEAE